jgi:hypothetical protein
MIDYEKAARRLIELHGSRLGMDKPPPMQIYLDPAGAVVPFEQVRDGSPGGMAGQVEFYDPKPGHGFYAMLFLQGEGVGRNGDKSRTFLITGPDWAIKAEIAGNKYLGNYTEDYVVDKRSEGGDKFLSRFLRR